MTVTRAPAGSAAREREYMPQLDSLRAIAVFGVMLSHFAMIDYAGRLGVRLFFVLSGFLITRILLDARLAIETRGSRIGRELKVFFSRRLLRLYPPLILAIGFAAAFDVASLRSTWGWHLSYLSNIYFARRGEWEGPLGPLWSLSVEEQFYLVWPLLILLVPYRRMIASIIAIVLSACVFRYAVIALHLPAFGAYVMPFQSFDALGLGALLGVMSVRPELSRISGEQMLQWSLYSGLGGIGAVVAIALASDHSAFDGTFRELFISLVFLWVIGAAATGFRGATGRLLTLAPIIYLGKISYGLYLYHDFVPGIIEGTWNRLGVASFNGIPLAASAWISGTAGSAGVKITALIALMLKIALSIAIASASWILVERPLAAFRKRIGSPRTDSSPLEPPPVPLNQRLGARIVD